MSELFEDIHRLAEFLNDANGSEQGEMSMQLLKLSEEVGEVMRAWIGMTGQNPRKGVTHSRADVLSELADVAITALVAIDRLGGYADAEVSEKAREMRNRYAAVNRG